MGRETMPADPHTFIPLAPKNVVPTNLELDPLRPRAVYEDPASGEQYVEITGKNRLGQNNHPLGQMVISMCCKGILKVSEAVPIRTPDGNTVIASRIIKLEKTQPVAGDFLKEVDAERWILKHIFGDGDHPFHPFGSENNLRTTEDGRYAWFDYAQGADNFFFLGSEIYQNNVLHAQEDGIVLIVLRKLQQLETHVSDSLFITSIFERITKAFPDKKMEDMFYEGTGKTPLDFQRQLFGRIHSAIQQLQTLPEAY